MQQWRPDDPPTLSICGISAAAPVDKQSYCWKRFRYERAYGAAAAAYINDIDPDVLICANVPIDSLTIIRRECVRPGRTFIIWLQDILSIGTRAILKRRSPFAGDLIGRRYEALERRNLETADRIVCITTDFLPTVEEWGIPPERCTVIENWAPTDELSPDAEAARWREEHGLAGKRIVLYAGTLGLKHNPALLIEVARDLVAAPGFEDVVVVVASEGAGADWLREQEARAPLPNFRLLPYQPYAQLGAMLASADVLTALLQAEAGVFSVPSKVLSYLCVGRPIVLAAPIRNLAVQTVERSDAGIAVEPEDVGGFVRAIRTILADPELAAGFGR